MYAQVMTTQAEPGLGLDENETVRLWEEHLARIYQDVQGFKGAYVLGNAGDRRGLTIILWDSEVDADNSTSLDLVLSHIRDSLGAPPAIDGYDVIFQV
jgi:heme-degrading monooxygenase HmoA